MFNFILSKLDEKLGTSYYKDYENSNLSKEQIKDLVEQVFIIGCEYGIMRF